MTQKFLIVGDLHYKGINPAGRTDNYQEALNRKLDEIDCLYRKHDCRLVIQTGDVYDSPGVSNPVQIDLIYRLQTLPPWLTVPGNHDLYAANPDSWRRTPLAILEAAGCVSVHNDHTTAERYGNVIVYGAGYRPDMDLSPNNYNCPAFPGEKRVTVGVYHGMLLPAPLHPDIRHTLIRDIPAPPDVTICGHTHHGFGIIRRPDGKLFINPGALCRDSASEADMRRTVQVCLLTVRDDGGTEARLIPLQSARPGHEVLSREHIEIKRERNERLETFLDLLRQDGEDKYLQIHEILDGLSAKEGGMLPPAVKAMALAYLAAAREELIKVS